MKLFAEEGVTVTVEQLKEELARQDKEELTEEDLENANGGIFFALAAACLASAGISMVMRTWRHLRKIGIKKF